MNTEDTLQPYVTKVAGRNFLVDHEANRIAFLDSRFYRTPSGAFVPSVTTILEAYPKGAQFYEWLKKHGEDADEIRDEAGRRGSVVHEATEILDLGGDLQLMDADGSPRYKLSEWAMIERYVDFRTRFDAYIHAVETKLAVDHVPYAGTLDRVMTIGGITYLVDIKTSGSIWPSYWLQQAAYHNLLHESRAAHRIFGEDSIPEIRMAILWLNARTKGPRNVKGVEIMQGQGWQLVEQPGTTEHYLDLFEKTHGLWMAENASQQPRQTSYQLSLSVKSAHLDTEQQTTDAKKR